MATLPHRAAALRIAQAQASLITTHPFFAILLFRLDRVADPSAETMWTDGTRLGYNPGYVLGLALDHLVGVLAHEVAHVAGLHPWRQGTRDGTAWNVACDHVANAVVQSAGLALPPGCVPAIPDRCAEELYVAPPPAAKSPQANAGDGGAATPPQARTDSASAPPSSKPGSGPAAPPQPGSSPAPPSPDPAGSAPAGNPPMSCGEIRPPTNPDGSALSQAERTRQMEEVRIAVRQALTAARRAGDVPAGIERLAAEALEPQVPWKEVLARFVDEQAARHDYSWTRPNRRLLPSGIILPSLWSPAYGNIVMGCDTSGSIAEEELREVCGEVLGALEAYQERGQEPSLTVAWFDVAVYPQVVESPDELKPQGGGGTYFNVVFDWVKEQEEQPRGVVMVTDGHSSRFGDDPGVPVLWVLTAPHRRFKPPFGEVAFTLNANP